MRDTTDDLLAWAGATPPAAHGTPYRFRGRQEPSAQLRQSVFAEVPEPREDGAVAVIRLYDPIDSYGGWWGVSAKEFVEALDALDEGVTEIQLHINSPGGEVFEAIAIMNALRQHPARVVATVDGLAASAASVLAAAADELVMAPNTELMIHDAWGICVGNAADMRDIAGRLDQLSDNLASVYARKAGGAVEEWREAMRAEQWFTADEAVSAGLADRVEGDEAVDDDAAAKNRFDLSLFAYAGRGAAPAPTIPGHDTAAARTTPEPPAASATGPSTTDPEGSPVVAFSDEQLTTMRQTLGLAQDADEATILAAIESRPPAQANQTEDPTVVRMDRTQYDDLMASAAEGREARAQQLREGRERLVNEAVQDGRIAPARRQAWLDRLEADPGDTATLEGLAKGLIPLAELGSGEVVDTTSDDALYASVYGTPKGA